MSDTLKEELIELLYHDSFEFRVTPTHKGMELEIFERSEERKEEIREVIEEWVCYGSLFEYLFKSGSCYSYEGLIMACEEGKDDDYKIIDVEIHIEINGPSPEESETIYIDFSSFLIAEKLALNPQLIGINNFENNLFNVEFVINEWQHVDKFDLFYCMDNEHIKIDLNEDQRKIIVDYIVEFAKSKEPQLDLIRSEYFDVSSVTIYCEENEITYKVNEYYEFLYSDVFD
jgi:hypothetical protein